MVALKWFLPGADSPRTDTDVSFNFLNTCEINNLYYFHSYILILNI